MWSGQENHGILYHHIGAFLFVFYSVCRFYKLTNYVCCCVYLLLFILQTCWGADREERHIYRKLRDEPYPTALSGVRSGYLRATTGEAGV